MLNLDGEQYDDTGGCPECKKETSGKQRHDGRIKGDADRLIIKRNSSGTKEIVKVYNGRMLGEETLTLGDLPGCN